VNQVSGELSVARFGAEVLVALARGRADAALSFGVGTTQATLEFKAGRPERGHVGVSRAALGRDAIVAHLRQFACASSGAYRIDPMTLDAQTSLGIDTLGEALAAVLAGASGAQLEVMWQARGAVVVAPATSFAAIVRAAQKRGAPALPMPAAPARLDQLSHGLDLAAQRLLAGLLFLGGLIGAAPDAERAPAAVAQPTEDHAPAVQAGVAVHRTSVAATDLAVDIETTFARLADQSHYQVLGVAKTANAEEVRRSYFQLAKRWHSDSFAGVDLGPRQAQVEAIFRRVGEAFVVLSNTNQRRDYDVLLERTALGLPTDGNSVLEAEMLFKKAQGLVRRGQAPAALPLLEQAVALNKGEPEFLAYLGFALHAVNGQPALVEARRLLQEAIKARAKLDVAYEFLGRIARIEGDPEEATRQLRKAVQLNPKNVEAERELRLIGMRSDKQAAGGGLLGFLKRS